MERGHFCEQEETGSRKIGIGKGICGYNNSCYLDTTLFCLLYETNVFDPILLRLDNDQSPEVKATISRLNVIAAALREPPYYCDSSTIQDFRNCLSVISEKMIDHMMDVEQFLHILFDKALKAERFIKYYCGERWSSNFLHHILLDINCDSQRVRVSDVQSLLNASMEQQNLTFVSVPEPALIIKMPRFDGKLMIFDAIRPNLTLDITHLIANNKNEDLKTTMDLMAVICLRQKHYTAYLRCVEFEAEKYTWVYFDSMAHPACPEVRLLHNFEDTMKWDDSTFFNSLQDDPHMRLAKDIHVCIYTRSRNRFDPQQNVTNPIDVGSLNPEGGNNDAVSNSTALCIREPNRQQQYSSEGQSRSMQPQNQIVGQFTIPVRENWILRFMQNYVYAGGTGSYRLWPCAEDGREIEPVNRITHFGLGIEERELGNPLNSILFALFYDSDVLIKTISEHSSSANFDLLEKVFPIFKSLQKKIYVNWEQSQPLRSYIERYFSYGNPRAIALIAFILNKVCNLDHLFGIVPNDYYFQATGKPQDNYPFLPPPYCIPYENVLRCFFDFHYSEFEKMQFPILILSTEEFYPFKPFSTLYIDMENVTRGKIPGRMELFAVICYERQEYSAYVRRSADSNMVPKTWWYHEINFEPGLFARVSELPNLETWIEENENKMRNSNYSNIGSLGPWDQVVSSLPMGHCRRILECSVVCVYVSM